MRNLAAALIAEKNKPNGSPWAICLQMSVPNGSTLYLTNYDQNIVWAGNTYLSFPFQLGDLKEGSDGTLNKVTLGVSNISREIMSILEQYRMIGQTAYIRFLNTLYLSNPDPSFMLEFGPLRIKETPFDMKTVNFVLGASNILQRDLPWHWFDRNRCRFAFASAKCGWTAAKGVTAGADAGSCDHTLDGANGCVAHNNYNVDVNGVAQASLGLRFGGFPGIPTDRSIYA